MAKKNLTLEEKINHQYFLKCCAYIEKEFLDYTSQQKLQKQAVLIVRGMSKGQPVANKNNEQNGDYPYKIVYLTLQLNKKTIINALKNKDFKGSEKNTVSYISAIVRDKINDVYTRVLKIKKEQETIDNVNTDIINYQGAGYQSNKNENKEINRNKNEEKFEDLW